MDALTPFDRIPEVAWRALQHGADEPAHPMHLLTLATVGADGRPSARLMVNRGADRTLGRLWFHTDSQMPKVGEMRAMPFACVTGWDRAAGVQLRIYGSVVLHQRDAVSSRHWEQLSSAAQWLYSTPDAGRTTESEAQGAAEPPDLRLPRDKRQIPHMLTARQRDHFVVIELQVETIEWLQANQKEHRGAIMRAEEHWVAVPE